MITKNPMQLKAFIKNKAAEKHISAQLVMQNYMLERLLERISLSPYKNNFIHKGGFLISAIVGFGIGHAGNNGSGHNDQGLHPDA